MAAEQEILQMYENKPLHYGKHKDIHWKWSSTLYQLLVIQQ